MCLKLNAPAKVNLSLSVLGRRLDGRHEVVTFMQPLNWGDEIVIKKRKSGFLFTCDDSRIKKNNLVEKAARLWFSAVKMDPCVSLHLKKKIPIAAGLGGGSSGAAVTLIGLNVLFKRLLSFFELRVLAQQLGADVSFFLEGVSSWCFEMGNILEVVPEFPLLNYVLINPKVSISTASAYLKWDLVWIKSLQCNRMKGGLIKKNLIFGNFFENDLEQLMLREHVSVRLIREVFFKLGADDVLMSGSGSTFYGVFLAEELALRAVDIFLAKFKNCWVRFCRGFHWSENDLIERVL